MGILGSLLGTSAAKASNAAAKMTFENQNKAIEGLNEYGNTLPGQYNHPPYPRDDLKVLKAFWHEDWYAVYPPLVHLAGRHK